MADVTIAAVTGIAATLFTSNDWLIGQYDVSHRRCTDLRDDFLWLSLTHRIVSAIGVA